MSVGPFIAGLVLGFILGGWLVARLIYRQVKPALQALEEMGGTDKVIETLEQAARDAESYNRLKRARLVK